MFNFSAINLKEVAGMQTVEAKLQEIVDFDLIEDAYNFTRALENKLVEEKLDQVDQELWLKYEEMIIVAKWISLSWLPEKEILDLFKKHLAKGYALEEYDIWERLKRYLLTLDFEDRDIFKEKIRMLMIRNNEVFTKQEPKTIQGWLQAYTEAVGTTKTASRISIARYFVSDHDFNQLTGYDKEKTQRLIRLYERLKLSSLTIDGLEEDVPMVLDNGDFVVYREGEMEVILKGDARVVKTDKGHEELDQVISKPNEADLKVSLFQDVFSKYNLDKEEAALVSSTADDIVVKTDNSLSNIAGILHQAILDANKIKVYAGLEILAKRDELINVLEGDTRFKNLAVQSNMDWDELLKFILQDELRSSENESARWYIDIINILKKNNSKEVEYLEDRAYFDRQDGSFKWI